MLLRLLLIVGLASAGTAEVRLDVPHFSQVEDGCGAASLAMVTAYWADRVDGARRASPEEIYQRLYSAEAGGIRLADMKTYLEESGYHAFTMQGKVSTLEEHLAKGRPLIVTLSEKRRFHFSVLAGADDKRFYLQDPARSEIRSMKRRKFRRKWAGGDRWLLLAAPRPDSDTSVAVEGVPALR